jgi:2-keto-4-pentenoate hydratase/2-oxohepta-3-ene-1,7-dioic acid hydratase in catechol pathway
VNGRIGSPIARPGKVVCIGLNYSDHAAETGAAIPERPVVFMKDPSTVVGPYVTPATSSTRARPPGVALGLPDHPYLRAWDTVRLEIDGLGWARQRFVAAP